MNIQAVLGRAAAIAPATANAAAQPPLNFSYILQVLLSLLLVLALLVGFLALIRRLSNRPLGRFSALKSIGGILLGGKERIVIVEIGEQWLVLGVTPNQINLLKEMPRPELPAPKESALPFQHWLTRARQRVVPVSAAKEQPKPLSADIPSTDGVSHP